MSNDPHRPKTASGVPEESPTDMQAERPTGIHEERPTSLQEERPTGLQEKPPAGKGPSCPSCGRPRVPAYRPFCSERCRDLDLARWFGEAYAVPAVEPGYDEDGEPS